MWEGEAAITALPVLLRSAASNPLAADSMRTFFENQVVSMLELGKVVEPVCSLSAINFNKAYWLRLVEQIPKIRHRQYQEAGFTLRLAGTDDLPPMLFCWHYR
jgi:hypothetical protein